MKFKVSLSGILAFLMFNACTTKEKNNYDGWKAYGGSYETIRYSSNKQIDTANVMQLTEVWAYESEGGADMTGKQIQCNPIVVDGVLYGTSPQLKLFAIDASTGKEIWVFNPSDPASTGGVKVDIPNTNRGVTYWTDGKNDKRVLYTSGSSIIAIDATTGVPVAEFGKNGLVNLADDLEGNFKGRSITSNTPGVVYKNTFILGTVVSESADAASGYIRGLDVKTGKLKWVFHTIPHPGEFGYDTWDDPEAYKYVGGANNWSGISLDEKRGIVFIPTGSASPDFYGGKRLGDNLFANSLIALDASTGKRIWHYQTVHHDVWDRDLPAAPALVTINREGKNIDAVAQPTKTGMLFLFDRETGKPIYPIEERPVSVETEIEGERLSPTQPFPLLPQPFVRQDFTEEELNNLVPDSSFQDIKKRWNSYKKGGPFQPSSKQGTIIFPGYDGGAEWGGPSFDPQTGIMYVNANEMPWVLTMMAVEKKQSENETYLQAGKRLYALNCGACHGADKKGTGDFPSLINVSSKYTESSFEEMIAAGRGRMPGFNHLPKEDKDAITSYVLGKHSKADKPYIVKQEKSNYYTDIPFATTGYNKFLTKEGYPAVRPPWGTLNAINLNTGELLWKVMLGDHPDFKPKGIETGTENYGGSVVTAGGLVFIASTPDSKIRAFHKTTGKILWEYDLPAPGYATPAIYSVGGKQYLVIACGGGKLGSKSGDKYVAFALPDKNQ